MEQPPGFEAQGSNGERLVCRLNKALYGLRQAPRAWFQTLRKYLVDQMNFQPSKAESSLFIRVHGGCATYLMIYIFDIILIGTSLS